MEEIETGLIEEKTEIYQLLIPSEMKLVREIKVQNKLLQFFVKYPK